MAERWQFLTPNLPVRDVAASQRWYRDVLAFAPLWIWEDNFGAVGNGEVELFLYQSEDPQPVVCSAFVADVEKLYDECRARGAEIAAELELKPWGVREFSVRDPDGHVFRIGRGEQAADASKLTVLQEVR